MDLKWVDGEEEQLEWKGRVFIGEEGRERGRGGGGDASGKEGNGWRRGRTRKLRPLLPKLTLRLPNGRGP